MVVKERLPEYIKRIMKERNLNYRKIAARARQDGFQLTHSTVGNIINRKSNDTGIETLRALAHGLGEPESVVLDVAKYDAIGSHERSDGFEQSDFAIMHREYNKLPKSDQDELRGVITMLMSDIRRRKLSSKNRKRSPRTRG